MGDQTPITDAVINRRLKQSSLESFAHAFVDVKTQGQFDTKVDRIYRQNANMRIGVSGGLQGFVTDLIAAWFAVALAFAAWWLVTKFRISQ